MAIQQPSSSPPCCPTEFNLFLRKRVRDIETLCANMGHANFIAMDTEHGAGISSIGLAFASTRLKPVEHPINPAAMTGFLEEDGSMQHLPDGTSPKPAIAQSICFNTRGFERSQPTRERVWGQPDEDIDVENVASKVMNAVQESKEAEPEKPSILVTYSSRAELIAISNLIPQLYNLFSNWVDLQPLIMDAYHSQTSYTRLDGLRISLRYAMQTLGFNTGYQPANLHHAGNDAPRTLAIMAYLTHKNVRFRSLNELEHVLRVNKHRKEQYRLKGTEKSRGLKRKRPGPPSQYPHVAKVTLVLAPDIGEEDRAGQTLAGAVEEPEENGRLQLPPVNVCRPDQAWDFFSSYGPNAIGRVCRENCYYVCVPSPEIPHHLIEDLDHTQASACPAAQAVLVEDVSDLRALGAAKREERAKRRQGQEIQDPTVDNQG